MYQQVLVGTDGSMTATRAVEAAARIARAHDAELTIAHVFNPRQGLRQEVARAEAPDEFKWRLSPGGAADTIVEGAVDRARVAAGDGSLRVRTRSEPGRAIPVLLGLIDDMDPDALVIGNRDMPTRLRFRRSVARTLSRRATCDVVIVDTLGRRDKRRKTVSAQVLRLA
jgi:nucleotide-binding universal stress UspA family protein